MPTDESDVEVEQLKPDPWWYRTAERLFTAVLILAFGIPVAIYTGKPVWGGLVGAAAAAAVNVLYWKAIKRERLSEVYNALKPWI